MVLTKKLCLKSSLICYASQKGTAQSIAEDLFDQILSSDLSSKCVLNCISKIDEVSDLEAYSCVIFIGSTTGDGDPPETAIQFIRQLKEHTSSGKSSPWLNYTILGLGDTNYTNFCNFGKTLDKYLQCAGSNRFYDCGWADDGTGLEEVVEPWIEKLLPALRSFFSTHSTDGSVLMQQNNVDFITSDMEINKNKKIDSFPAIVPSPDSTKLRMESNKSERDDSESLNVLFPSLNLPSNQDINTHVVRKCKFDNENTLTLLPAPISYILSEISEDEILDSIKKINIESVLYPPQCSKVIPCNIVQACCLTSDNAVKTALELSLRSCSGEEFLYEPGDSFGIIVKNRAIEVDLILHLLGFPDKADNLVKLTLDPTSKKKIATLPKFIPEKVSLRYIFTYCLDIRAIPKKSILRSLVNFTSDEVEKRRLMELVSKEGADEYNQIVRSQGLSFIDLLIYFPSCKPPLSLLIELLPRLLPRYYSITSSPLVDTCLISFVFNVLAIPADGSVSFNRTGICTGWLQSLVSESLEKKEANSLDLVTGMVEKQEVNNSDIVTGMVNLTIASDVGDSEILIYFRNNHQFRLPKEICTPLIMIGPGTGVAPFIGFLKHRESQLASLGVTGTDKPHTWLFFGCRHKERDFLYEQELKSFQENKILTELFVSFSRDQPPHDTKYVQDNITKHGEEIVKFVHERNASIYVCGDAKNMSRNVMDALIKVIQASLKLEEIDARKYVAQLQMSHRYLQDVWA